MSIRHWLPLAAALLASAPAAAQTLTLDDVVRITLERSPAIAAAHAEVQRHEGALRTAHGAYDPQLRTALTTRGDRAFITDSTSTVPRSLSETAYEVGVSQRLRSGIVVSPRFTLARTGEPGLAEAVRNVATTSVDVRVPLGRARGGGIPAAQERAATRGYEAAVLDLRHRAGESVLRAARAYWGYVAAVRRVAVLADAEARAGRLAEQTRRMVDADERPAVDLLPARANVISRRAARTAGEQAVVSARLELALAAGISPDSLAALPPPRLDFPALEAHPLPAAGDALAQRADLASARKRLEAARGLLRGARAETRPQVDLDVSIGYTGAEQGGQLRQLVGSLGGEQRGLQARVQLSYGLAVGNRVAQGQAIQSAAAAREAELAASELAQRVELQAATARAVLQGSAEELKLAREAVGLHTSAVQSESRKYQLGTSTLFDVMNAEDRLTSAVLAGIDAELRHAAARAQLDFEMGTPPA